MSEEKQIGLIKFLDTKRSVEDLRLCLEILKEFKENESVYEWMAPFVGWMRFEQFEDYLKLLTGIESETVDDKVALEYFKNKKL